MKRLHVLLYDTASCMALNTANLLILSLGAPFKLDRMWWLKIQVSIATERPVDRFKNPEINALPSEVR